MRLIFFSGTRAASSWALRGWLALKLANLAFEEIVVDIRRPQRFSNLSKIAELSPSASVPCLIVDDRPIFDSLAICEFANDMSGGLLSPDEPLTRAEARSFACWQHAGLSQICSRISFESAFYPYKRKLTEQEQAEAGRLFQATEARLGEFGGAFLFGDISVADIMLVPTAIRLLRHSPDFSNAPLTEEWMARLVALDPVSEWLRQADAEPHIWFDDYLVKGSSDLLCAREVKAAADLPAIG